LVGGSFFSTNEKAFAACLTFACSVWLRQMPGVTSPLSAICTDGSKQLGRYNLKSCVDHSLIKITASLHIGACTKSQAHKKAK
jgi:hypothetical protein